jgi:hypothetical protein
VKVGMSDGLEHLSKKTRERAYKFAKSAESLDIKLGSVRFTPSYDYMSYYLANGLDYLVVYCTPGAYLVEKWYEEDKTLKVSYSAVRNIRHFLQWAKREDYADADFLFDSLDDDGERDLRRFLENLDD